MGETGGEPDPAAVAAAMYARDAAARAHGIEIVEVGRGFARLRMAVRADMINGHGICHGGMTFFLADTALAYASNAENRVAVAAAANIVFTAPAREGDVLTAECRLVHQASRSGVFDVRVTAADGAAVAVFRGQTVRRGGTVLQ